VRKEAGCQSPAQKKPYQSVSAKSSQASVGSVGDLSRSVACICRVCV